jgi:hypothetical protein
MNQLSVFTDTIVSDDVVVHEEEVFAPYSTGELHVTMDEPLVLHQGCVVLPPTPRLRDQRGRALPMCEPLRESTYLYAESGATLPLTVRYAARRR